MTVGMMWFDNSSLTLEEKIRKAVAYYQKKFLKAPTLCLCPPGTQKFPEQVDGVTVRLFGSVLPHHLWIGTEDESLLPESMQEPA